MNINNLSLDEMIGQRFIFGVNDKNINPIIKLVREHAIGGVILYRRNYRSYEDMLAVVKKFKEANRDNKIPLFISIDQEGGRVNRIPDEIHNLRNICDVSKTDEGMVSEYADIISSVLYESGINMDFAPVLDIDNHSKSNVLVKRCFYGDYNDVYRMGKVYVDKTRENHVLSVIKHFPGHGSSKRDSHFFIPYIFNRDELFNRHIIPFNKMMDDKVDALMVGHLVVRGETGLLPASICDSFIKKYIRGRNYDKLIITDEVNMLKKHLIYYFSFIDKAIKSSSDIILVKVKDYDEGVGILNRYKKLLVNNDELNANLVDSVKRIMVAKKQYKVNDDVNFKGINIDKINKQIDKINARLN